MALAAAVSMAFAQKSYLTSVGSAKQLIVDGKPFVILGGELGNSSAACFSDIDTIFPKLSRMGLNTVLVPAYWDLIEPEEGKFNFELTDHVLATANRNNLKVVFLWFGAWKNSMSCYAPLWFKTDYKRFPRVKTQSGKPLEIASPFSENVFAADSKAFTQWLHHLKAVDTAGTVIMIQIENEIGMLESARDYSAQANSLFNADVPKALTGFLTKNKKYLHPAMLEKWGNNGYKTSGKWIEVFGADVFTDEIFMAYHYSCYVERMAQIARSIYNVPLYVNAALNSRGRKPGEYPSAGPLAHLIDVWHCGAPSVDFISPDIYDSGFEGWVAQYKLHNNPLFIPEMRRCEANGVQAFYAIGEHDAIGVSPFAIENGTDAPTAHPVMAYNTLRTMVPLIAKHMGKGAMNGLLFDQQNTERILSRDGMRITCRHFFTLPWDPRATNGSPWPAGGGMLIRLAANEYIVAGSGIVVVFEKDAETRVEKALGEDGFAAAGSSVQYDANTWQSKSRIGIGYVDEVQVQPNGELKYVRRLNGDEDHQGRHVRIGVDDFKVLHVKLYEYK